jgi:site-specific recombinase XerD
VGTINRDGLLEQFKAHLSDSGLAPATVVNYSADLRAFFRWCEETNDVVSSPFCLDSSEIQAFCSYLRDTKKQAPATVNRRLQALRKFYSLAITQGWTLTNPAEDASLLSESASERSRSLAPEDVAHLLDTVRHSRPRWAARDWAIFQVLLGAGLKLGELTELRICDVRLDAGEPYLLARSSPGDPGRTIPVEAEVCDALDSYLSKRQAAEGVDHFFVNRDGNPLSTRSVQRLLHYYAQAADLDGLTTQALRFVYAQKLYESCGDLKMVAQYLGHRHLATTIRYLRPTLSSE